MSSSDDSSDDGVGVKSDSEVEEDNRAEEIAELKMKIASLQQAKQALAKRTRDDRISEELETIATRIKELITLERETLETEITEVDEKVREIKDETRLIAGIKFDVGQLALAIKESAKQDELRRLEEEVGLLVKKTVETSQSVDFVARNIVKALNK